ncbi:MAG TPA: hypothetical protein VFJ12_15370, partial [Segeticoccus sp.]|nr:hypothetical protein [Segeticoccus sp.]
MTTGRLLRSLGGLLLLAALVAGTFALGPAMDRSLPSARAPVPTGPTVVVGVGALTWEDVNPRTAPHLWSLLADGGSAALVVRSVHATTCPLDGWLGLSAGVRASSSPGGAQASPPCVPVPRPEPIDGHAVRVPGWADWRELADQGLMEARPGLLAEALQRHG